MASTSLRELIVSVSADTTKYQREMQRAGQQSGQLFQKVREGGPQASRAWDQQTQAVRTHATAIEASRQAIGRYIGVAAAALGAGRLIGLADEWTNISARVRLATESAEEFQHVQERLGRIADATYRSYGEAADQFASTARMMRELGFATEDTLDSAEALGLALVAGGADAQRGASAMSAWTKAIALGQIDTEKWMTLLEQTPRVAQALADGLGKTTTEMTAMARAGELTAQVSVAALVSQMEKLRAEVDAMPTEFRDAVGRVNNRLLVLVGGLNEAYGATEKMVGGLEFLAEHLDVVVNIASGAAIGIFGSRLIGAGKDAIQAAQGFMQARDAQRALTAARVADAEHSVVAAAMQADQARRQKAFYADIMRTATSKAELTQATRRYEVATRTASQATAAHRTALQSLDGAQKAAASSKGALAGVGRAAMGVMGGPTGLAITIGMVAAGMLTLRSNTDKAESSLENWNGTAAEAVELARKLNAQQLAGAIVQMSQEIESALADVDAAIDRLGAKFQQLDPAAVVQLRELAGQFRAGKLTADEFAAAVDRVNEASMSRTGLAGNQGAVNAVTTLTAGLANAAQAADSKRENLEQVNAVNQETERQATASAAAIREQATAFDMVSAAGEAAGKRIESGLLSLPGQIERIGKSAQEVAQLDMRDWLMDRTSRMGITNEDDPRYQELLEQGRQWVAQVTELDAKQQALTASTRALSAARGEAASATAADLYLEQLNQSYAEQVQSLERQIALHGELGRAAAMAYDLANGALSGLAQSQKDYLQESAEWLDFLDDMAALDGVWTEVAREHAEYGENTKKTLTGMTAFADQAARNMQTALGDNLYNILDGRFTDIGDAFSNMLKRMAAEMMASEIWRQLGTALAGSTGQGWWGNFARSVGSAMTDPGKAAGGRVRPHSLQPVAEHGPEILQYGGRTMLMMGAQDGMVTPLMNKAGGGSSGASSMPTINIHIEKGASEDRVDPPRRNAEGGFDIRVMIRNLVAQSIGDGSLDGVAGAAWGVGRRGIPYG